MLENPVAEKDNQDPKLCLTDNARAVLERRYLRKGEDGKPIETVEEMFHRVASTVAGVDADYGQDAGRTAQDFYDLLTTLRFFPNSPTFTGAGTPLGQLAACFVLPIEDDMGRDPAGIFSTLRAAALIQQTGGGNGFAFSRLRPRGDIVKTSNGTATGPVGFLRVYDKAFGEVAQGGTRRGANMAVLRVDHPDIRDFIRCKAREGDVTNFNISVGITDDFMRAVQNDEDFDLVNPRDGSVWETVRARDLFDEIVKYAHHNGEPGVLFLDTANRENPVPHLYKLEATNPCFVGDTRIATSQGLLTIAEMADMVACFHVATDDRAPLGGRGKAAQRPGIVLRAASPAWKTRENARVLRLETKQGYQVVATPDHKFLTSDRGYVELQELRVGDRVLLQSEEGAWSQTYELPNRVHVEKALVAMAHGGDHASGSTVTRRDFADQYSNVPTRWSQELGRVVGWLVGDGWLSAASNAPVGMVFANTEVREMVHGYLREWFGDGHLVDRGSHEQLTYGRLPYEFFTSLGVLAVPATHKRVPESIWSAPREAVVGFLQGLFTADGSVQRNDAKQDCTVRLASSSRDLLRDVQLLLSNFGIISRIYHRRSAQRRPMPDGHGGLKEYQTQDQYELVIGKSNRDRFARLIGFISEEKQTKLTSFIDGMSRGPYCERFIDTVTNVEDAGSADVYDLTEPATHSLLANGIVAHNCGEQWLGPHENCCLGSINLAQHVTEQGNIDWEKLRDSVERATHFLDNVVNANKYVPAVPELERAAYNARRIGLGIMGLADLMYHQGVRYGSEDGEELAAQVMEFVRFHCMKTSIELARRRGPFPVIKGSIYDPEDLKWKPPAPLTPYRRDFGRPPLDWNEIVEGIRHYGIRNAAQTTVAPTGTIATVAGCEGYGCEPVFALAYTRHVQDGDRELDLQYTSPLFRQALIEAGIDEEARQAIYDEVMRTGTCQHIEAVPEHIRYTFVVANDITPEEHVRMQAAIQRFVDNSISKTSNFPATATEEDVAKAYMMAWELGCKGLTVYVTGTREKVVLETKETLEAKQETDAALQPAVDLNGGFIKKPRPRKLRGYTYKQATPLGTAYVHVTEDEEGHPFEVFLNVGKGGSDTSAAAEAIGRLISLVLRLPSPRSPEERLREVIAQLSDIGGGRTLGFGAHRVASLPDGVAQALAEHLGQPAVPAPPLSSEPAGNGAARFTDDYCPECGQATLAREEGCRKCYSCGFSEC
jgi:ribonucleoside-diphosphate reductase alpha chain